MNPQNPSPPNQGAATFPCQQCGAALQYNASTQQMKCPYCGATQAARPQPQQQQPQYGQAPQMGGGPPPGAGIVREIPIEEGMAMAQRGYGTPVKQVECKECGATVNVGPNDQTVKCTFCASQQVLPREAAGTNIRPESLVPFKVDKNAANSNFEKWIKGLWFRPSDLWRLAKVEQLGGVYIPFWTFDSMVHSHWSAMSGTYYYETEHYTDSQGNRQTRQVQHTRWWPSSGSRSDFYDDTIVCASKGLPEDLVDKFKTFSTRELIPYTPEYLAGWKAESYAIDLMPGWAKGQAKMASEQQSRCAGDVPGDTHRDLSVQNNFTRVTFKHVLLPIWIASFRYQDKPYQFLVNGQTGEVVGKAPWSVIKIVLFVLLIVAILVGIGFAFKYMKDNKRRGELDRPVPVLALQA